VKIALALGTALSLVVPIFPGAAGWIGRAHAQSPLRPEVVDLRFEGNFTFSDNAIGAAIVTRETECRSVVLQITLFCPLGADFAWDRRYLSPRIFAEDYVRVHLFYRQRGYREVQVDTVLTRPTETTVEIGFRVTEGEPHRIVSLDVLGVESIPDPDIVADLPIGEGDRLDLVVLNMARDTLTQRLQNQGYPHAEVLQNIFIPAGTHDAEVELDVYTGPLSRIGEIDIVGNEEVEDQVILRMLPFGEGGLYRRELLLEAQRNLYGLEIFLNSAIVEDLENEPDSIVPLAVQVNEGNTHRVRAGGGWNTEECFNVEAQWANRNFFGGARRLQLRGRVSNLFTRALDRSELCKDAGTGVYSDLDFVVAADFSQPFVFTRRNSFAASIFAERQSLPNVYVREAAGLTLALTRSVGRRSPLTLSYRPQIARLEAAEVFFCTSALVCDPAEIDLLQEENTISPVGLTLTRDMTDNPLEPRAGYRGIIDLEAAGGWSGSDYAHQRALAEIAGFWGVSPSVVLAGRVRAGWLRAGVFQGLTAATGEPRRVAHPERRFYGGGSNSVRGYAQNQLGPKVLTVDVAELVLPRPTATEPVCRPQQVVLLTCDASAVPEAALLERPTGGSELLEGNLEARISFGDSPASLATFLDFGRVWGENDPRLTLEGMAFTPGIGLRYATPIGPIRIDLGYRGRTTRQLPVITSQVRPWVEGVDDPEDRIGYRPADNPGIDWVRRGDLALLEPRVRVGEGEAWYRGLQLHFSIGQAF
jgi:outer membrane protein insertion porin family/translocation and assembly module TamA